MTDRDPSPEEAVEMFLNSRRTQDTEHTVQTYHYRLKQFVEWCEDNGIDRVSEIDGWHVEQFETARRADLAPVSLKGQMASVKQLADYLARIGAVDEDLPDKVQPPTVDRAAQSSDVKLAQDDARALLRYFRNDVGSYGTVEHVVLEILWHVGCRQSSLRALDLDDFDAEDQSLAFRHRPPETPLKNKLDSERLVAIPDPVADAIDFYVQRERHDKRDDAGRRPLVTSNRGRPSESTIRGWTYMATQPCLHSPCPHDKDRASCDWINRDQSSRCPSSRSPHQVRTGSITWQLNRGVPVDVVSERADVSPRVIREHYDKAFEREEMEERRRKYVDDLDIDEEDDS